MQTCTAAATLALSAPQRTRHDLPGWRSAPGGLFGPSIGGARDRQEKGDPEEGDAEETGQKVASPQQAGCAPTSSWITQS